MTLPVLPPDLEARYRQMIETRAQQIIASAREGGREVSASDANWLRRQLYRELTVYGTFHGPRRSA